MEEQSYRAYSIAEAAKELDVTVTTVIRWANARKLVWAMWMKGGTKSVTAASVAKMKKKRAQAQALAAPSEEEN